MNLEDLNDWQLNQVIHNVTEAKGKYNLDFSCIGKVVWKDKESGEIYEFNRNEVIKYTKNYFDWNMIMPLSVRLGVCLNNPNEVGYHEALTFDDHGYVKISISDKSAQRALVICCIKALELRGEL